MTQRAFLFTTHICICCLRGAFRTIPILPNCRLQLRDLSRVCPRTKTRPGSRNSSAGSEFHAPSTCSQSPESGRGTSCSCGSAFCLPGQRPRGRDGGGLGGRGPGLNISGFRLPVVKRQMFPKVVEKTELSSHFRRNPKQMILTFLLIWSFEGDED